MLGRYDEGWKEVIRVFLPQFLRFFFPKMAQEIDFVKGFQFLDQELARISKKGLGKGDCAMGVFAVPLRITNWQNRFLPAEKQGEKVECEALVDSGAAELALPAELIHRLRLEPVGTVHVYTADGGQHEYRVFGIAEVEVQGRVCQVRAIELPHGAEPLLGAVPLKEMDWHISPSGKKLVPNPRSPERPLLPLC